MQVAHAKVMASVGVLSRNSGQTLRQALESVKELDDIIILKHLSTEPGESH